MKTVVMAVLALAVVLLTACSENRIEGCWITHADGVELSPQVPFPADAEPLAMNPDDSYQIWCARKINSNSHGNIISEDQRTLKIDALPRDAELHIYPNERDAVYRGHSVSSSANVWNALEEGSASQTSVYRWIPLTLAIAVIVALVAYIIRSRRHRDARGSESNAVVRF